MAAAGWFAPIGTYDRSMPGKAQETTRVDAPITDLHGSSANEEMRRPLTALALIAPLGLFAEIWRFLNEDKAVLLAEREWAALGGLVGIEANLVPVIILVVGCLAVQLIRRLPWDLPGPLLIVQVLLWASIWCVVRYAVFFTNEQLAGHGLIAEGELDRLDAFAQLGLAFSGALQEELIFRAGLLGLFCLMARGFENQQRLLSYFVALPLSAVLFSLAHTEIVNHRAGAEPFTWAGFVRHLLGGLLYGLIFIRQGLGTATFTHFFFNVAIMFRLGPW